MIELYKNRTINYDKPVLIYRNLHKKGVWYSIKQGNLVVGHTQELVLDSCKFIVNPTGRDKVRKLKKKFVHAFVKGWINNMFQIVKVHKVTYNPYYNDYFNINGKKIEETEWVSIDKNGVWTSNIIYE